MPDAASAVPRHRRLQQHIGLENAGQRRQIQAGIGADVQAPAIECVCPYQGVGQQGRYPGNMPRRQQPVQVAGLDPQQAVVGTQQLAAHVLVARGAPPSGHAQLAGQHDGAVVGVRQCRINQAGRCLICHIHWQLYGRSADPRAPHWAPIPTRAAPMQPQDILPDHQNDVQVNGLIVRKGSVGAFLASVRDWQDPASDDATRATAEADLRGLLPGLHALGLFQVLAARDPALQRLIDSLS